MSLRDILLALLVVLIWGFNFVVIQIGLQGLPPLLFSALRFLFAAVPLVFFVRRPAIGWKLMLGYSMFQFGIQFMLLFSGMNLGFPAGLASLVIQLQAFFTIGLAVFLLRERPLATQLCGALIALAGMGLVAWHLQVDATMIGFLMVVGAGLSWGIANIVTKRIGKVNPMALVAWGSLLAVPPLAACSLLLEGPGAWYSAAQHMSWLTVGAILFQSYPNTVFGFGIWSVLMLRYPTATIAPFALLVPVSGMLSAALVLGEPLPWWKISAAALVLTGLALNQFGPRWFSPRVALR